MLRWSRVTVAAVALLALLTALVPASAAAPATTAVSWSTSTVWTWATRAMPATTGHDQRVEAVISGATTTRRNGAFALRSSGPGDRVLVSFSGTRYQVRDYVAGRERLLVDKPFTHGTTGRATVELRGSTLVSRWNGEVVASTTSEVLSRHVGRGTGVVVWQDRAFAVAVSDATSRDLAAPTTGPVPGPVVSPGPSPSVAGTWRSGAAGTGVPDGRFGAWRGRPVQIAGTWNDNAASQPYQWSLRPGFEYGDWQGDVDVAVGGIYKDRGETWAAAASGAYDARWRQSLGAVQQAWGSRPGTVYVRFAHEFNGDWYPWSVEGAEAAHFVAAWKRLRAIQLDVAPRTRLVFCPNAETSAANRLDWRTAFPGAAYVDVVSVDLYNQYPFIRTAEEFSAASGRLDGTGAPLGLEQHRLFAASVGRPFAISEWSSNADLGDAPVFVTELHRWLTRHGGTGPGQVLYEIHFNVADYGGGKFQLSPTSRQPLTAAEYVRLW